MASGYHIGPCSKSKHYSWDFMHTNGLLLCRRVTCGLCVAAFTYMDNKETDD